MYTFTSNLDKKEYDKFVENYSMASFMQEYEWANIKDNWNNFHCGLYKDKKLVAVCMILVKKVFKNIKLFYIPRGYLIDFTNINDLEIMTKNIKALAKENNAYVVKIDPNFCKSDNSFKDEEVEHNYSKNYEIKHNNLIKLGYKHTGMNKEMGKNLQPQYNVMAPICDINSKILTVDEVLKTYKSKFKYYLGNFHEKRGIYFEITNDITKLDKFVELLRITEKKQNISLRNKEYFVKILNNFIDRSYIFFGNIDLKKYLEFLKENNGKEGEIEEVRNLIKENGNILTVSTGLLLLPKNKKGIRTSEYLYAGNSSLFSKLNISAGLVFEMIKFSIENNCHYCNLGGVNGNLNDHLTIFKQKFNGRVMEFTGEYDLPVSWIYYPIKTFYPILLKIYKKIKR
ncbi:MAG: aminoacyltransferase [Firmicutes bacterium]|nr:aminoacyltransferase [Bacillota bacterium]